MIVSLPSHLEPHLPAGAAPSLGDRTFILHDWSADYSYRAEAGALSIKCMLHGDALYEAGGGRFRVDATSFLVLNHGQPYRIDIRSRTPVESFCVFFARGFAEDALRSLTTPAGRLLDDPWPPPDGTVSMVERLYPHDDLVTPELMAIRSALRRGAADTGWLDERLRTVVERLLELHRGVYREAERLPALRRSTRLELYRRLHRARDYIDASLAEPVTLPSAAAVACMSPHHFLRLFRSAFDETPHRYLTRRRLERAQRLLATTDWPVTQVCFEVGFESPGSFSWLFRHHVGVPPGVFRRRARGGGNGEPGTGTWELETGNREPASFLAPV